MIEYKTGVCRYFPHAALKARNLMDVMKKSYSGEAVYFMECAQEMSINLLTDSDPIANDLGKFEMEHTCSDLSTYKFGIAEDVGAPSMFKSHIAGFQSLTMSICMAPFKVTRSRSLTVQDIENLGFTQEYIEKIKPGAVATSHGWFKVTNRLMCTTPPLNQYALVRCPIYGNKLDDTKLGLQLIVDGSVTVDQSLVVERVSSNNICGINQECMYTNDFVNVLGIGTFPKGSLTISTTGETAVTHGLGIVLGATELLIDPPFHLGCFKFEDSSLDSLTPTATETAKECLVVCNDKSLRFAAVLAGTECYCFPDLPQESLIPSKVIY